MEMLRKFPHVLIAVTMFASVLGMTATRANAQAALLVLLFGEKVASENFYFSLKAGANAADISNITGETKWGFNFGLLATIKLNEKFSLIPEFSPLSPKGVKNVPTTTSGDQSLDLLISGDRSNTFDLGYIDIPVVLAYKIDDKFTVGAGPYFSFLTGATEVFESSLDGKELTLEHGIKDEFNRGDIGLVFEAMYSLGEARHGKGLNIHVRFQRGFVDLLKETQQDAVKNTVFQVYVSLPFVNVEEDEKEN